jgi:protease PrsW
LERPIGPKEFILFKRTWFKLFVPGIVLFIAAERALSITQNPHLLPTLIVVGAFLVPVTFITYVYERDRDRDIPIGAVATTFLWGGAVGILVAGLVEYETLRHLGLLALLGVGAIEESAKLIFPMGLYFRDRYLHEADGLLFGVASGMGFAALETMGYGLTAFLDSHGSLTTLEDTLLTRGILSPAGHAAWTGFLCSVIWRQRQRAGRRTLNWRIVGAFVMVVLLHTTWDAFGSLSTRTSASVAIDIIGLAIVAAFSLWLLIRRVRKADADHPTQTQAT